MFGVLLLFSAAVLGSLNGALIKLIHREGDGLDGVTIAFYRSLGYDVEQRASLGKVLSSNEGGRA